MSTLEFNELLVTSENYLKPFAITLTHDHDSASDLMQETLYKAFANRDKYNLGTNIKAWLYTIMRNIFINDYRRRAIHPIVYNDFSADTAYHGEARVGNAGESILKEKEIKTAIYNLQSIFRNPFLLYIEGYKYHEIANMYGEPIGTIKSRIHFARKILKEKIKRY